VVEAIPISIEFTPKGWFKMVIPALLPRKERGNQDYIQENPALSQQILQVLLSSAANVP